jgi:hypothetical protein
MNTPSNAERKPSPIDAPREASAGKQAAQPMAETIVPSDPSFSNKPVNVIVDILNRFG